MKRKDYEDKYDDFSSIYLASPSAKSRRLDPNLLGLTNEDPTISGVVSEVVEPLAAATPPTPSVGGGDGCNEKALVVYNPTNTPLFKSPTSPDFSLIVSSDLIPGLKEQFMLLGNSKMVKPLMDSMAEDKVTDVSDDRLAVVPWVAARAEPQAAGMSAAMEAEEVEMMDADDKSNGNVSEAAVEGAEGLEQWQQQQHCMRPKLFPNTYTPVSW